MHVYANVPRVEVEVRHAGRVRALESSAHLVEDLLQLPIGERILQEALLERDSGVPAEDDVVLSALKDDRFDLLHPGDPSDLAQGADLSREDVLPRLAVDQLQHQGRDAAGDEEGVPGRALAHEGRPPRAGELREVALGQHGYLGSPQPVHQGPHFTSGKPRRNVCWK